MRGTDAGALRKFAVTIVRKRRSQTAATVGLIGGGAAKPPDRQMNFTWAS